MNFGFVIDNRKCIGCHACTVACKAEHDVPIGVNRTWVKYIEKGSYPDVSRFFSVMRCNHCADAPCVDICPVTALYIRDDGIVDFDNNRCIGCKSCTQACPYDAIYIDPDSHTAAKCNYCAHRIDIGLEPACVNVCPEQAIVSGDLDDAESKIARLVARHQVQARKVEKGTEPKLFYIDGDVGSLNPSLTEQQDQYMQTDQARGVGHYAKYAEKRLQEADLDTLKKQLAKARSIADGVGSGSADPVVGKMLDPVAGAKFRKIHDAPSKGVLWGWEVSAYVWTKAIGAGAFLVAFPASLFGPESSSAVMEIAAWTSLIFLTLTGALLVKDLDKPTRFLYVLLRPQWGSWLVRGGYAITLFGGFLTAWLAGNYLEVPRLTEIAGWGAFVSGLVVAVYTAFLFAQAKGRDFWQSPVLALHMLIHAFIAGAAFLSLASYVFDTGAALLPFFRTVLMYGIGANMLVLLFELATPHATSDSKLTVKMITRGPFAVLFWIGVVLLGNLLPMGTLAFGSSLITDVTAFVLILTGIYCTEHIWVRAPQLVPLS